MAAPTFLALRQQLAEMIWPNGIPENLTGPIRQMFIDALIDLQKSVPCLEQRNTTVYPQSATYFKCGLTVVEKAPRGIIRRVYTVRDEKFCDPVHYRQVSYPELRCWSRNLASQVESPANEDLPALPLGYKYPEPTTDSEWGRSLTGIWALEKETLFVAPWLQSDEALVVEWDGIRRTYADTDVISIGGLDSDAGGDDLKRAIRLFVIKEYSRLFEQDFGAAREYERDWMEARADLIHRCREETRVRQAERCQAETNELVNNWTKEATADESAYEEGPPTIFAIIGDFGESEDNEAANDVAEMVNSWDPEFIVTTGDNDYVNDYDESVGSRYDESKMIPCLGNHDLDQVSGGVAGAPYFAFFTAPQNKSYYDVAKSRVHLFMLNSGLNTAAELVEDAGNEYGGVQSDWLLMRLLKSTAAWKLVFCHHPPFTSGSSHSAETKLRWPFALMGAHALFSGHNHHYERLEKGGFPYIVNGAGGRELNGFSGSPDAASVVRYSSDYGAIKGTATCSTLKLEFINRAGVVIDTLTLTK